MTISAKEVQELRKMSGAGMMECKSALSDSGGDLSQAFKLLREKGIAKAEKKSGRDANEGLIGVRVQAEKASIIEVNSETDFVSRNSEFHSLVNSILDISMNDESKSLSNNENVAELISSAVGKIGENFDPSLHEAVEHSGEGDSQIIDAVLRKGYLFQGSLIRPAMVKVKSE